MIKPAVLLGLFWLLPGFALAAEPLDINNSSQRGPSQRRSLWDTNCHNSINRITGGQSPRFTACMAPADNRILRWNSSVAVAVAFSEAIALGSNTTRLPCLITHIEITKSSMIVSGGRGWNKARRITYIPPSTPIMEPILDSASCIRLSMP